MGLSFPVAPMKATLGSLPSDDERWAYEIKWDGHRTLAHVHPSGTRLQTTSGRDSSDRWPEVTGIDRSLNATSAILDGEMLVIGDDGRPSFDLVQRRDPGRHPAVFHVFDVLSINDTDTVDLAYTDRRSLLADVLDEGDHWRVPAHRVGGGADLLAATVEQHLEGLIAKRLDSIYRIGTRSKDWIKVKNRSRVDVTIGGFTEGTGARASTFGALLVGVRGGDRLRFAGGVGTGFDQRTLDDLVARLRPLVTTSCPFDPEPPAAVQRAATWVRPELVATVEIAEFTNDGHVRHASFVELSDAR
jgi:bifunctional non-homologous end joining protein LigD